MWVVPRTSLTEDQLHAVDLSADRHCIIVGGPGSGKTLVLAHRARRLLDEGVQPGRLRLLVYTNLLKNYIGSGLEDLDVPEDSVLTFDKWTLDLHRRFVGGRYPVQQQYGRYLPDYVQVRRQILTRLREEDLPPVLDVVLVDEAQDLDEEAVALLTGVAEHITVALDARQQLYPDKIGLDEARALLGVGRAQGSLLSAYRCTPLIVELAAAFLPDEEAKRFRASNLMPMQEREKPVLHTSSSSSDQWDTIAKHLGARAILGQRTAVLVRTNRELKSAVKALRTRGVDVVGQKEADFEDDRPVVMTYHSSKGLTVDAVFLPDLTESDFDDHGDPVLARNLVFVAITRATSWVWMGTHEGKSLPTVEGFDAFDDLVARGVIVRSGTAQAPSASPSSAGATPASAGGRPSIIDLL